MSRHVSLPAALFLGLLVTSIQAGDKRGKLLLRPGYDPTAEQVDVFAAIDAGDISVAMRPRDETGGAIFVENLSDRPLTVVLPEAIVGVQVFPQSIFGNGNSSVGQNQNQNQGQNQPVGGGPTNGNANGNSGPLFGANANGNRPGPGFFSVPPGHVTRIEYRSVCLVHGAKEPRRGQVYRLVRVADYSNDPRLPELLKLVGEGDVDPQAAQAAAWHIANDMSWQSLQDKRTPHLNAAPTRYFSQGDLQLAQQIVQRINSVAASQTNALPAAQSIDVVSSGNGSLESSPRD
ncbi:MAG: hypothetical protein R3B90_07555 [Planctomycetaceae bacterium]